MNSRLYDALKWAAMIGLPAIGAAYFSLGEVWGLPLVTQVVGTVTVIEVFLGTVLQISKTSYMKSPEGMDGEVLVNGDGLKKFIVNDPEIIKGKKTARFKVVEDPDLPLS